MEDEITQLKLDFRNTDQELNTILLMRKKLYWFLVIGTFLAPLGIFWHFILCFLIFGLFAVLYFTSAYISYGHKNNLQRRRAYLSDRLHQLGHRIEQI